MLTVYPGKWIAVKKFFLNLSKGEQKRRFLERLDNPEKNWKFSSSDVKERECWDAYQEAYEDMIRHTASEYAPGVSGSGGQQMVYAASGLALRGRCVAGHEFEVSEGERRGEGGA